MEPLWEVYYLVHLKKKNNMNIEQIIKDKKGTVVDVRTVEEFMGGHVADSINIPLNEVSNRLEEFKNMEKPIILCCASGGRSSMATQFISQNGLDAYNAGSWMDVNYLQSL